MITFFAVPKTLEEKGEIDARSVYVGNVSKAINQFENKSRIKYMYCIIILAKECQCYCTCCFRASNTQCSYMTPEKKIDYMYKIQIWKQHACATCVQLLLRDV